MSVGRYLASFVATELERETADAIGSELAAGRVPSTSDVRKIVKARTGRAPAYGTVARVLTRLRALGVLNWTTAYVRRWHAANGTHEEIGGPIPVRQANAYRRTHTGRYASGSFRLPVRNLALVGWVLFAAAGVASRAELIDSDARARLGSRIEPARGDSPVPEKKKLDTAPSLSIQSAPVAIADDYAWKHRDRLLPWLRE